MEVARRFALLFALTLAIALVAGTAAADPPSPEAIAEAKQRYARGVELYEHGADSAAIVELERAYSLAPHYKVLYSIGLVHLQLGNFVGAQKAFRQYLVDGAAEIPAARKTEVEGRIARLADFVATVEITTSVPDVEIVVDDVSFGKTPFASPVLLNPGKHRITASKVGYLAETKIISVAGADRVQVPLELKEEQSTPPSEPTIVVPKTEKRKEPRRAIMLPPPEGGSRVWIGWTATGALAAAAVVTGVLAISANSDLTHAKEDRPTAGNELDRLASKAHTLGLVTDVLAGGALIAGGISMYFTLKGKPATRAAIGPSFVGLSGTF